MAQLGGVLLFVDFGEVGVEGGIHVGGQGAGIEQHLRYRDAGGPGAGQVLEAVLQEARGRAGGAVGADLFLVPEHDGHVGAEAVAVFGVEQGFQRGEDADAVVLAVAAHQGLVEAHIGGWAGGHGLEFGGDEVFLADAVLGVEQLQHMLLDGILELPVFGGGGRGAVAEDDVQLFGVKDIGQGLAVLFAGQVGQQVGDGEDGFPGFFAKGHADALAVFQHHHAVQGQGPGQPLVFADAAVVVGLGLGHAGLFQQRALLEVQAGAVGMGGDEVHALLQRDLALAGGEDGLAAQVAEHGVLFEVIAEAGFLQALLHIGHGLALGLALADEIHVTPDQGVHLAFLGGSGVDVPGIAGGVVKGGGVCFFHGLSFGSACGAVVSGIGPPGASVFHPSARRPREAAGREAGRDGAARMPGQCPVLIPSSVPATAA